MEPRFNKIWDSRRERLGRRPGRVPGLDILRGLALINMIFYHFLYDFTYIFAHPVSWFSIRQGFVWQQAICFTFILISGISFKLGKNHRKNFLLLALCAAIISGATLLMIPEELIVFGILHFMAGALLLTALLNKALEKIPAPAGLAAAVVLFILLRNLPAGYLSIFSWWRYQLPAELYQTTWLFFLGLPAPRFSSADYFPLLPWWFLYLAGYFGSGYWVRFSALWQKRHGDAAGKVCRFWDATLGAMGRHSLVIYMLHQPVIYGALLVLSATVFAP